MTLSAWYSVLLAIPVLLLGEVLVRKFKVLSRFNIPAPVVGGLLIAFAVLLTNIGGFCALQIGTKVGAQWWTWLVTPEIEWTKAPEKSVNLPFLVGFFTCIGLNASWSLVKRGSLPVLIFLAVAAALAVLQNILGVAVAKLLGAPPLLGVVCGSVTMTGGHATALGFASDLEKAGLHGAATIGAAAATFGLVTGGLLGGPIGGRLIRRNNLQPSAPPTTHLEMGQSGESGILKDLSALAKFRGGFITHFLLLLACIKLGAWVSYFIQKMNLTFPVYMGAMLLGASVRAIVDLSGGKWIRTEIVDTIGSVMLGIFLTVAMLSLNLIELAAVALPMLIILSMQVVVMAIWAWYVTFRAMGKDFDAAVITGGHCGFGLGATPNAVANMKSLVETFGPSAKAFLVVPIVGGFLNDFPNALTITAFINFLKN